MIKLTKNQFIEMLSDGKFVRLGYTKSIAAIENLIRQSDYVWETFEEFKRYDVKSIRSTFIEHDEVEKNDGDYCRESFPKSDMYMFIVNDVRYMIHAYKNGEGEVFTVSVKAMKVEE